MSKKPNAQEFLRAMQGAQEVETSAPTAPIVEAAEVQELRKPTRAVTRARKPSRTQLKHFGGYLEEETLEKIALLRVRLKKDNSELIKMAIDDLHRKHSAKRAFGDT
jgi:hypothetical protein